MAFDLSLKIMSKEEVDVCALKICYEVVCVYVLLLCAKRQRDGGEREDNRY